MSDWKHDAQVLRTQRCGIAAYRTNPGTQMAPQCGQPARWWTDDLAPVTTWMCDECCDGIVGGIDGNPDVHVTEVET